MATMSSERANAVARRPGEWIQVVGRIGLATQGVLYAVVGLLALQVASGRNEVADQRGAIEAVADQRFGRFLLLVLTIGLALHACWRFVLAFRGGVGDDAESLAKRSLDFGRGALYAGFTVIAARLLIDARSQNSVGVEEQRQAVGTVLDWPGGRAIVVLIGVAIIAAGVWHITRAFTRSFLDDMDLHRHSDAFRGAVAACGSIGFFARELSSAWSGGSWSSPGVTTTRTTQAVSTRRYDVWPLLITVPHCCGSPHLACWCSAFFGSVTRGCATGLRSRPPDYLQVAIPPSTGMTAPVTNADAREAR